MLVKDSPKSTSSKLYAEIDLSSLEKIVKSISNVFDVQKDEDNVMFKFRDKDKDNVTVVLNEVDEERLVSMMALQVPDGCFIGTLIGVNNWNQSKNSHGTFAYMTQADDKTLIVIESDLILRGGVEEENLKSWVKNLVNHINPFEELVISTIQETGEDSKLLNGDSSNVWSILGDVGNIFLDATLSTIGYLATDSE
jgi:hypothetical protein